MLLVLACGVLALGHDGGELHGRLLESFGVNAEVVLHVLEVPVHAAVGHDGRETPVDYGHVLVLLLQAEDGVVLPHYRYLGHVLGSLSVQGNLPDLLLVHACGNPLSELIILVLACLGIL